MTRGGEGLSKSSGSKGRLTGLVILLSNYEVFMGLRG
jgi:hypothetical protein